MDARARHEGPGAGAVVLRLGAIWLVETIGLLLFAWILPGVEIKDVEAALLTSALIGVLNAVLYPLVMTFAASIAMATFGLLALALNVAVVMLADAISPGFNVTSLGAALVLVLGLALVNSILTAALAIDDEGSFFRGVILRQARRSRRRAGEEETDATPGVIFLEIDGLSERILREALADGRMPHLGAWVASGSHEIHAWECDLSSQTSASQAGLLQGTNADIPAFRWYDRELGRPLVSSKPADVAVIEERASNGDGLLAHGGASRGNLVSGDAPFKTLTISSIAGAVADRKRRAEAWRSFLSNSYAMPRTLLLFFGDVVTERREARRQRRADIQPRVDRGGTYALIRAATTAFIPEATTSMLIGDIFRGIPSAYATFVSYDEIAHHSGIRAPDALAILQRLDTTFARIEKATRLAPRPYKIVVLSDHGQSQGATFLQRYGETLDDVVQRLANGNVHGSGGTDDEASDQLYLALGEVAESGSRGTGWLAHRLGRRHSEEAEHPRPVAPDDDVLVFSSGNLGLVYFPELAERPTLEDIRALHPDLVRGLTQHEGVGFVAGHSVLRGIVALGADGDHEAETGRVTGLDPLARYGPNAAAHLRRELSFANAPDLLVMSRYDAATEEVAAFEELVGSHGGLGGPQAHPFLLNPTELPVPDGEIVGAGAVHAIMKTWLRDVAQPSERPAAPTPA